MKHCIYILLLAAISCNNQQHTDKPSTYLDATLLATPKSGKEICWEGSIKSKIPVFIHYQLDGSLVIGEITYLNTKDKLPIRLLGTIEEDKSYRLLEFDKTGNITGIIIGLFKGPSFNGSWFSPKTRKEMPLHLSMKDTVINSPSILADADNIFGSYHYQYDEDGYQGDFNIEKIDNSNVSFDIFSVTGAPGRNIAEIEKDTISMKGTEFVYKVPETDSCEFIVKCYKGFAVINYTKGYCDGQFGLNATIDGIFIKTE